MTFLIILVGAILFVLGAIISYFSGIRSLQASRRLADYRVRQRYVARARWSLVGGFVLVAVAAVLLIMNKPASKPAVPPAAVSPSATVPATAQATTSPAASPSATGTTTAPENTATSFVLTPSPAATATSGLTATPFMPIAVQAMVQGTMTPVFPISVGKLRFSTDINNYELIAPGTSFHNPIKSVYAVFNYQPLGVKIQWTALWYHNGGLKYIDTTSWRSSPASIGITAWGQDPQAWLPGIYEVQVFIGTTWKTSGTFELVGDPPTITPTALPPTAVPSHMSTSTPSLTPTSTQTSLPTATRTPLPSSTWTASPTPTSTRTPAPTATHAAAPTATSTAAPTATRTATNTSTPVPSKTPLGAAPAASTATPSRTPTRTLVPTATLTSTRMPSATPTRPASSTATGLPTQTPSPSASSTPTRKPAPSATPTPSSTPTRAPTRTAPPTATRAATNTVTPTPKPPTSTPTFTPTPLPVTIKVFFTNTQNLENRVQPFDDQVLRLIPASANPIAAALDEYFKGPNAQEQGKGLAAVSNGFVGYRRIEFSNGILGIYLTGNCRPSGTGYSIVQPLTETMKQFPGVTYVKIFDEYEHTRDPLGNNDSEPVCLDVIFTSTPTKTATPTKSPVPTATWTPSTTPTHTLVPTATATASRTPTRTPLPTATWTPSNTPTRTPLPTNTSAPTSTPTRTPLPSPTQIPSNTPTRTPLPTATRIPSATPTRTPLPTATRIPSTTPTRTPLPTATQFPSATPTRTPLPSPTRIPSNTPTRTPLPTATRIPSATPTRTPPPSPTRIPTNTPTRTPLPTATRIPSATPTRTPLPTATHIPSATPTRTPLPTATTIPTQAPANTPLPTATRIPAATPTRTPLPTATFAPTHAPTRTPLPTATRIPSATPTRTPLSTATRIPTNTPTRTPLPTSTPVPSNTATRKPLPTATSVPSSTPTRTPTPTFTPTSTASMTLSPAVTSGVGCNRAVFVGDVTIPDYTIVQLGQPFTKTWRIRNNGTCTWTTGYRLVFVGGDKLGAPDSVPMPINVAPGQTADVSVNMTAPDAAGHYEGDWLLQSADGKSFGVGASAVEHIWVRIRAIPPAFKTATAIPESPTATVAIVETVTATPTSIPLPPNAAQVQYDFAANACAAQWQSNTGVLPCPGKEGDPNGFVLGMERAQLEDGSTASLPTLLTFPQDSADGYILAVYPEYEVKAGDHLQTSVSCEQGATSCSVLFRISYLDASSTPHDLWTLGEFYDGKYFNLDLDLSRLAGQKVKFVLNVNSLGSAAGDRALWVAPRIVHFQITEPTATATPVPSLTAPTSTASLAPAVSTATAQAILPTPAVSSQNQAPSIQQIFDSIISFFQQLFGVK